MDDDQDLAVRTGRVSSSYRIGTLWCFPSPPSCALRFEQLWKTWSKRIGGRSVQDVEKRVDELGERIGVSGGEVECVDGANLQVQAPRYKEPDGLSRGNRRREAPVDYSRELPW
jgi:hypothetical protein